MRVDEEANWEAQCAMKRFRDCRVSCNSLTTTTATKTRGLLCGDRNLVRV